MSGFARVSVQTNDGDRRAARAGDIGNINPVLTQITADAASTITAAAMVGGVITSSGKTVSRVFTTDTAVNINTVFPNMDVADSFVIQVASLDASTVVVAGGVGVTASGNLTVLANSAKEFVITKTAAATFNIVGL